MGSSGLGSPNLSNGGYRLQVVRTLMIISVYSVLSLVTLFDDIIYTPCVIQGCCPCFVRIIKLNLKLRLEVCVGPVAQD